jgi:hypothetical protein
MRFRMDWLDQGNHFPKEFSTNGHW